ncbi:MAG: MFS transporter [Firmicutes bacterium]|jgi:MFS family permease|nr:MFS transporter [Bacillota bacterium]
MTNTVERKQRALFCLVTMIFWFTLYIYVPILPNYVTYHGGSLKMVGLVVGSYGLVQMLLRIPLGIWSDRIGKRQVFITLGVFLALASSLVMGVFPTVPAMLVGRALSGAAAATWVTFTVLFSSYFPSQDAPKAMGLAMFYNSVGQMLATSMGGYMAELFGWKVPFLVGAIVGLVGVLLSLRIKETEWIDRTPLQVPELLAVGRERGLLIVSGLAILTQCMTFATVYGFTPIYAESIGASPGELSLLTFFSTLPVAIAAWSSSTGLVARYGERQIVTTGLILGALAAAIVPFTKTLPQLYITQAIGSLGRGIVFPVLMGLSIQTVPEQKRATAMGFFQAIYALGMFGGPVLVGIIGDISGLTGGFLATGLIGLIGGWLALRLLPGGRQQAQRYHSGLAGKQ